MPAVLVQMPESLLDERRRLGHDKRDEVWDGVIHMVPPASSRHQGIAGDLYVALVQIARPLGLRALFESGVFDPIAGLKNYRVPDLLVVDPTHLSKRGVEGRARLLVEILSPDDESRDKLPFYARVGVDEVWLIDPGTRVVEVHARRGDALVRIDPDPRGVVAAPALAIELAVVDGPLLRLTWAGGTADV